MRATFLLSPSFLTQGRMGARKAGLAHDVICFDSFLDQKMLERWLLRCHSSVVVVKFWVLRPVIVTVVICWDVMLRILVPNLFYFDLGYFFVTPWCYLVYDVSHPCILRKTVMYKAKRPKIMYTFQQICSSNLFFVCFCIPCQKHVWSHLLEFIHMASNIF